MIGPILCRLACAATKSPTLWEKAAEKAVLAATGILAVSAAEGVVSMFGGAKKKEESPTNQQRRRCGNGMMQKDGGWREVR